MSELILPQERELAPLRFAESRGFHLNYVDTGRYLYAVQDWAHGILGYTYTSPSKSWDKLRRIAQKNHRVDLRDYTVRFSCKLPYARYETEIDFANVDGLVSISQRLPYTRRDLAVSFLSLTGDELLPQTRRLKTSGDVYLMYAAVVNLYKIGHSISAADRYEGMCSMSPCPIDLVWETHVDDRFALEKQLHEQYADKRHHGEWFSLSPEDVQAITSIH